MYIDKYINIYSYVYSYIYYCIYVIAFCICLRAGKSEIAGQKECLISIWRQLINLQRGQQAIKSSPPHPQPLMQFSY